MAKKSRTAWALVVILILLVFHLLIFYGHDCMYLNSGWTPIFVSILEKTRYKPEYQ